MRTSNQFRARKNAGEEPSGLRCVIEPLEPRQLFSITYYISASGNDAASGTSTSQAFATIARVNSLDLNAGDQVLFEGGRTFSGNLAFTGSDSGTAASPVTIGSYGGSRATISAGNGTAVSVQDAGGFVVRDLNITGTGRTTNNGNGISFLNTLGGDVKLAYLRVDDVDVHDFGIFGIVVDNRVGKSGYRDVRITDSLAHDNTWGGIYVFGEFSSSATGYAHEDVYVGHCKAYNNPGASGSSMGNSGNGIVLSDVDGGVIERSVARDNGWLCNSTNGGPVGIWAWDSNDITIQHNESYNNQTGGPQDGGGFDLDGGTTNSVMQYNYSHGNEGAGYLVSMFSGARSSGNNVIRYNISQNDGRANGYGAVTTYGNIGETNVYNNTVYISGSASPAVLILTAPGGLRLRNNIFLAADGAALVQSASGSGVTFEGNLYWSPRGTFRVNYAGATYSTLPAWRSATTQEQLHGQNVGLNVAPLLNNPGTGPTYDNADLLNNLTMYRPQSSSSVIDAGINLAAEFGFNTGGVDFYGTAVPQGPRPDIGAGERVADGAPLPQGTTSNGLAVTYFNNLDLTGAVVTRVDPTVNFDWGSGSPNATIDPDTFSARWTGRVQATATQTYTFYTNSDDGVRLWVNGKLLIDDWNNQFATERSGIIALVAGQKYDIQMDYFDNGGGALAQLSWSGPSTPKQIIPTSQLTPNAYISNDIGGPSPAGSTVVVTPGRDFNLTAGGADVYGTSDQFQFAQRTVVGDFDINVRVASLTNADPWTKAGLMARASLDPSAANVFALVSPTTYRLTSRATASGATTSIGDGAVSYPNAWVRLRRTGNLFTAFRSTDGINWTQYASTTVNLPQTLFVGMALTSHHPGTAATAQFRGLV